MNSIKVLSGEHRAVKIMLQVLDKICLKLENKEEVPIEHVTAILDFYKGFVDKCHHAKEEEFLFPTLKSIKVPKINEIVLTLLQEHDLGRDNVKKMTEELQNKYAKELFETKFVIYAKKYIELLNKHIDKEENNVFKIADQKLTSIKDAELVKLFEKIELERLGIGKHEQYHELIKQLKNYYLK